MVAGVAPLTDVLLQLERDERESQSWLAAPNEPYLYRVVHQRVAIRAWKSTTAPTLGQRRSGEVVRVVEMQGLWARLHPDECAAATVAVPRSELPRLREAAAREGGRLGGGAGADGEGQRAWMLVDGAEVGLGALLEPVPGAPAPGAEVPPPPRPLSAQEWEMQRGLSLGIIDLKDLHEELQGHRELVRAAVERDGLALEHASPELRGDRHTVLAAWRQNPRALRFASEELQRDLLFRGEVGPAVEAAGGVAAKPPGWLASLEASRSSQRPH